MTYFADPETELVEIQRAEAVRRAAAAQIDSLDQSGALGGTVDRLAGYSNQFGWLKPGVAWSLAAAGIPPDSDQARAIGARAAAAQAVAGLGAYQAGDAVKAGALTAHTSADPVAAMLARFADSTSSLSAAGDDARALGDVYAHTPFDELRAAGAPEWLILSRGVQENKIDPAALKKMGGGESGLLGAVSHVLKPVVRGAFTGLAAGAQALGGAIRDEAGLQQETGGLAGGTPVMVGGVTDRQLPTTGPIVNPRYVNPIAQTDAGVAIGHLLRGEKVDLGSGFLPAGTVVEEREANELRAGTIAGHAVTPGRLYADLVFEPGSKPYSVLSGVTDAFVALKLDPANAALLKAGEINRGRDLFAEAGGILGLRRTVSPAGVEAWLNSQRGQRVLDWFARNDDFYKSWLATGRGKIAPETLTALRDATTPEEVSDILRPLLGTVIPTKSTVTPLMGAALESRYSRASVRLLNRMPGTAIDLEDHTQAVNQVEAFLRNVKAPTATVATFTERAARAVDRNQMFGVVTDMMGEAGGILDRAGVNNPELRSQLTRLFVNSTEDTRKYLVDEIGRGSPIWTEIAVDGSTRVVDGPHLFVEHIGRFVPMPDARALRAATSRYSALLANPAVKWPTAAVDALMTDVWKPMQLLRLAWPVRVIGEEQVRMAASGYDSMFRHPLSYIAYVTGRKGAIDLTGDALREAEDFRAALTHGGSAWRDAHYLRTGQWQIYRKTDHEAGRYLPAWGDEIAQLAADPLAPIVANASSLDDAKRLVWESPGGIKFRKMLARGRAAEGEFEHPELLVRTTGRPWVPGQPIESSDQYVESVAKRISVKTGDHGDLLDVVRTGKFGGKSIFHPGGTKLDRDFVKGLRPYLEFGPDAVKGESMVRLTDRGVKAGLDQATSWMFNALMSVPTNKLSRSPEFVQAYWKRAESMLPFLTEDAQVAARAAAERAGIKMAAVATHGDLALADVDLIAKGHALEDVKGLLYDMSEKGQLFDTTRVLFPFGEAWKEVIGRWGKILYQRPNVARRGQQVVGAARGQGLGELAGAPAGEGFFYTDENGQEVFNYPGSEWLTKKFAGVPVPFKGSVQGLSIGTSVVPGVGPVVQIPAGWLVPNTPDWRAARDLLLPFGEYPSGSLGEIVNGALPPWARKFMTGVGEGYDPETVRQFGNANVQVQRYLLSTGQYGDSRPEQARLVADAEKVAKRVYLIRAFAQFGAPSAPTPEWQVLDKDGRLRNTQVLVNEYHDLQADPNVGPDGATQAMLDKYGPEVFGVMQSMSFQNVLGVQATRDAADWVAANPDVKRDLPNVYGFFTPQGGDFDYTVYAEQIKSGNRQPLSPEEWRRLENNLKANYQYQRVRNLVGPHPNDQQRALLSQLREALIAQYPGFGDMHGIEQRADPAEMVRELYDAVKRPDLVKTDAGQALTVYLQARDLVQAKAEAEGLSSFRTAESMRPGRDLLRALGAQLSAEHPDFVNMFNLVFDREMADDLPVPGG